MRTLIGWIHGTDTNTYKSEDGLLEKPPLKIVPFPEKVRDPAPRLSRDGADFA